MEKLRISHEKLAHLKNLSAENGIIGALAIDQRGSLKKMLKWHKLFQEMKRSLNLNN